MKWLWPAALLWAGFQGQGAPNPNPDVKYLPEWGLSVSRPPKPKNEEWEFKGTGVKFNCPFSVSHKVDEVSIEFLMREPATGFTAYDPKQAGEALFRDLSNSPHLKDGRKRAPIRATRLPGNAASNVAAWYLEMEFKDSNDKPLEFRCWSFVGKESQCLYLIVVVTGQDLYAKYQKEINFILASVKIHRLPR